MFYIIWNSIFALASFIWIGITYERFDEFWSVSMAFFINLLAFPIMVSSIILMVKYLCTDNAKSRNRLNWAVYLTMVGTFLIHMVVMSVHCARELHLDYVWGNLMMLGVQLGFHLYFKTRISEWSETIEPEGQ